MYNYSSGTYVLFARSKYCLPWCLCFAHGGGMEYGMQPAGLCPTQRELVLKCNALKYATP